MKTNPQELFKHLAENNTLDQVSQIIKDLRQLLILHCQEQVKQAENTAEYHKQVLHNI